MVRGLVEFDGNEAARIRMIEGTGLWLQLEQGAQILGWCVY